MAGEGSVSFERAADVYDRTRLTDPAALVRAIDLVDEVLPPAATPNARRKAATPRSPAPTTRC